ncbi:MAG TPA: hypothetical protein VM370_05775 [Candidatus Thermoplasmatota archaeon]|nr:hypothetical protein [Candidatus Thermoplasmatota archaeon]
MPHGVSDQFLRILQNEKKGSIRAIALALALLPVAYFMAELTDERFFGIVVYAAFAALALGIGAGLLWTRHRTAQYNESLRQNWNGWMRMSLSCARIDEVARHVANKRDRVGLRSGAAALLVVLNGALFGFLWAEVDWGVSFGLVVTVTNGLVLGFLVGHAVWHWRWTAQFNKALDELLSDGAVGLWGEV